MELNWSTFLLEVINFAILVWLLKVLFYRPVKEVIEQRRQGIEQRMSQAEQLENEARSLHDQYSGRLTAWEEEKARAWEVLRTELGEEKAKRLDGLATILEQEREKASVLEERRREEALQAARDKGLELGSRFVARLLQRIADQPLETRLVEMMLEDLAELSDSGIRRLRDLLGRTGSERFTVNSAYPLVPDQRRAIEVRLTSLVGRAVSCTFREDRTLIAGVEVTAGALVLRANLRDELHFFAGAVHAEA